MRVRYAVAAGFVVVVAALIFMRDEGYLGGRTDGGPLSVGAGDVSAEAAPGRSVGFGLQPDLEGDPVEIQSVRPDFKSPGLDFRAARTSPAALRCGSCDYERDGKLFVGSTYKGGGQAVVGLRAQRPGAYYALGLITDYIRGIRRFRSYSDQELCITVGRQAECGDASIPDAVLAEVGGPSHYGKRTARFTLTNLSPRTIEVSGLTVDGGTVAPDAFGLRAGAGRTVRLDLEGCDRVESLRARVDGEAVDVPLSFPLDC